MKSSQISSSSQSASAPAQNGLKRYGLGLSSHSRPHGHGIPSYFAARRHKKVLRDNLSAAINKPTIRRLARRGGIRRIKSDIYPTAQDVVKERLKLILEHAFALVDLANRKTVTTLDVIYALRVIGTPIYGFGMIEKGADIADHAAKYREKKRKHAEERERVARLNQSRSNTRVDRASEDSRDRRAATRELQDGRVHNFMRQMKFGARAK